MHPAQYLSSVKEEASALASAASKASVDSPVSGCPGWDLHKLVLHTGLVHHFVAGIIEARTVDPPQERDSPRAPSGAGVVGWFEEASGRLVSALEGVADEPGLPLWHWGGCNQTAGFWLRRMAHETSVHRWDAEDVSGAARPIGTPMALDGVDEFLQVMLPRAALELPDEGLGGSVHFHATDGQGEWLVSPENGQLRVSKGHSPRDVTIRGTASDLNLFTWNRVSPDHLEILGDDSIARRWADTVRL